MMLSDTNTTLERSREFKEGAFDIGDPILIMEYLRKNAYSNPKRAICQEIMCNARDAHREVGSDKQVIVTLPSRMNPVWSCRDFGPGITPVRMSDVFMRFGKSTKRTDNTQTGGFGIGAKTPWAYTDTFLITTICDIEGHRIKYHYAAVIAENRVPKLVQMADPTATTEPTGTTISFNVEARDQNEFARYTYEVSKYWTTRPSIVGETDYKSHWLISKYKFKNENWGLAENRDSSSIVVIDGIPYALNMDGFREKLTDAERSLVNYNFCEFYFNVGELSVSLNREALYYDDRTTKRIVERIREMISHIRSHYEKLVSTSTTLWDAAIAFKQAVGFFHSCDSFLKGIQWNGMIIPTQSIHGGNVGVEIVHYERSAANDWKFPNKVRRFTRDGRICFTDHSKLIMGDSRSKIEYMFEQDKTLKHVYVFHRRFTGSEYDARYASWLKDTNVMALNPIDIETVPAAPRIPRTKSAKPANRVRVKTYVWSGCDFTDTEIDSDELENGSGIYVPCYRRRAMSDNKCERELDNVRYGLSVSRFRDIFNKSDKIYGIQKDLLPKLGKGWVSLYDHVKNSIKKMAETMNVPETTIISIVSDDYSNRIQSQGKFFELVKKNLDKMPSCVIKYYEESVKLESIATNANFNLRACTLKEDVVSFLKLDNKCLNEIKKMKDAVWSNCKLIGFVNFASYGYNEDTSSHLITYLNAIKQNELPVAEVA
jgi:hypothetical protein